MSHNLLCSVVIPLFYRHGKISCRVGFRAESMLKRA
jgi:hypothetical protein